MPKGRRRSRQEDRRWLEEYEGGKTLQKIATESRRATSTVWDGIEAAQKERDDLRVREHLLRDAYGRHFDDLLGVLKAIAADAEESNADGLLRAADLRTQLLQEALVSHIPDSPLWGAVDEWTKAAREQRLATRKLEAATDRLIDKVPSAVGSRMDKPGVAKSLLFAVDVLARDRELSHMDYRDEPEGLYWGSYSLSRQDADKTTRQRIRATHGKMLKQAASAKAVESHRPHVHRWERAKRAVELEVEKLLLRGILPGSCDLCPGQVRGRRRRTRSKGR